MQIGFFINLGAVEALHCLQKLKTPYASIPHERLIEIKNLVDQNTDRNNDDVVVILKPLIFDQREEALIEEIKKFLAIPENNDRKIIIVYGAAHNFEKYFHPKTFEYIATANLSFLSVCQLSMAGIKPH